MPGMRKLPDSEDLPWQDVVERDYRPWDGERLTIDTARLTVEQSVRAILAHMPATALR